MIELEIANNGVIINTDGGKEIFPTNSEALLFIAYQLEGAGSSWEEFKSMYKIIVQSLIIPASLSNPDAPTSREVLLNILAMTSGHIRVYGMGHEIQHISNDTDGNIFLSDQPRVGICGRCGSTVVESLTSVDEDESPYAGYCPEHDEDLTGIEINPLEKKDA